MPFSLDRLGSLAAAMILAAAALLAWSGTSASFKEVVYGVDTARVTKVRNAVIAGISTSFAFLSAVSLIAFLQSDFRWSVQSVLGFGAISIGVAVFVFAGTLWQQTVVGVFRGRIIRSVMARLNAKHPPTDDPETRG